MHSEITYLSHLLEMDSSNQLAQLEAEIEYLLHSNMERLQWLLYRIDVNEKQLNEALQQSDLPAAKVITAHLINRCSEILETRKQYGQSGDELSFDLD